MGSFLISMVVYQSHNNNIMIYGSMWLGPTEKSFRFLAFLIDLKRWFWGVFTSEHAIVTPLRPLLWSCKPSHWFVEPVDIGDPTMVGEILQIRCPRMPKTQGSHNKFWKHTGVGTVASRRTTGKIFVVDWLEKCVSKGNYIYILFPSEHAFLNVLGPLWQKWLKYRKSRTNLHILGKFRTSPKMNKLGKLLWSLSSKAFSIHCISHPGELKSTFIPR